MELPISLGLPGELGALVKVVGVNGEPVWSIRKSTGKIYLDLCWNSNSPPIPTQKLEKEAPQPSNKDKVVRSPNSTSPVPVVNPVRKGETKRKKKKKKSPSTLRRDKQRYLQWQAKLCHPVSLQTQPTQVQPAAQDTQAVQETK